MPGKTATSLTQYLLLWAAALIWLFPGHVSFMAGNPLLDPLSLAVVLVLGVVCVGTRWREVNDPRLMFAMLILLMATAMSFVGFLVKPAQGLNAHYRPATATSEEVATSLAITRRENAIDFTGRTNDTRNYSTAAKIKHSVQTLLQTPLPFAGAVSASWEGFITIPEGVSRIELASETGTAEFRLDNVVLAGNATRLAKAGIYKLSIHYKNTTIGANKIALRWKAGTETQAVPTEFLTPNAPSPIATTIGKMLQLFASLMWVAAFAWALTVAKPRWRARQWISMGELMLLMVLPQKALARGGYKI